MICAKGEFIDYVIKSPKIPGWKLFHRYLPNKLRFWLAKKFGEKTPVEISHNLLTNAGIALLAKRLGGASVAPVGYIATGTSGTPPSPNDIALGQEVYRQQATVEYESTNVSDDTVKLTATFSITGSYTLREAGVFNDNSGGTLYDRSLFSTPRNVQNGDTHVVIARLIIERQS